MAINQKPCDLTITEAAAEIARGELTSLKLVSSCLERIDALEARIQAWVLLDREGALETAGRLDQELRRGKRRGPLHGIPMGIKDIFYTAGLPTKAGSPFWSGFVPAYDAASVARLKEAGAVILGKTHTTQFAYADPAPTHNPWNTAHTPGGSSSGSGAGVATGMCLAAFGSQTMGSVLRPAAYNGIVGFKPQHGRISTYGVVPVSWTLDHVGVLARNVTDAALVFQAVAGYDARDYHSLEMPVPDCLSNLENQKAPHLGLVKKYFFELADDEMCRHTEEAAERLRQAGARVEEIALPSSFASIRDIGAIIMTAETTANHQEMFARHKDEYAPKIRELIEKGLTIPATEYAKALQTRLEQSADIEPVLHRVDALLTPGVTGAAPRGLDSTGNPTMQTPWSVIGVPSISLPTGLNKDGLPLAIQLVGPPRAEDRLLAVARWCEKALNVHLRPPLE